MFIIDVTQPLVMLLLTVATGLLIFLGKEIKKPVAPAFALLIFLVLVVMHSIQLGLIPEATYEQDYKTLLGCLSYDLTMIFVAFFGYLWVDDIAARFYKKKSIDNSLDWFWNKI